MFIHQSKNEPLTHADQYRQKGEIPTKEEAA